MKINFLKKGSILLVSFFFLFIFLFLVNATTISETQVVGVTVEVPTSPTNYSTITVNNSDYTEHWITSEGVLGDVADISHSWLDDLAWSVAGHTIDTDFLPDSTLSYDIGSGASRWDWLYVRNISTENIEVSENLIINNLCNSTNCYTLSNLLTGSGGISPWLNTSDYLYIDSDYPQHINISGNASFGGGGIFSGAILADDTVGYENIRFGVFAHTPRILFDNGSNVGQIDYVGETIRFILNETGVGNRATMRINSSTVRIGATGSRRDLYLYGNIIGVNPAGGGANIQMDGDIDATGNCTCNNVFLPAYIRVPNNNTQNVLVSMQWVNITLDKKQTALQKNIGHTWNDETNDTITINDAGIYKITYTGSFVDSAPNPDAHIGMRLYSLNGGSVIVKGSYSEVDTHRQDEEVFNTHSFLTEFSAGEQFKVQFTSDDTTVSSYLHATFEPGGSIIRLSIHKVSNA